MLREQAVKDVAEVQAAYMEGDGKIRVITKDNSRHKEPETRGE